MCSLYLCLPEDGNLKAETCNKVQDLRSVYPCIASIIVNDDQQDATIFGSQNIYILLVIIYIYTSDARIHGREVYKCQTGKRNILIQENQKKTV